MRGNTDIEDFHCESKKRDHEFYAIKVETKESDPINNYGITT